ncbi:hypothetical protein [Treponema primitia]|uniref:hypothetical protein n=1 Tax=Treponema primitia TaxID=88058 RepID=UPI000255563A|nr:hypothetical protein [Treponema primitia]
MKGNNGFLFFALTLVLGACAGNFAACSADPVIPPEYIVNLPSLPVPWQEMLGSPHWRLVWLNPQGIPQSLETAGGGKTAIAAASEWATPVLAFPYWPGRGILPGEMRPAGGILPFDTSGSKLQLSWQGGVEAWFYRELTEARNTATGTIDTTTLNKRRPEYFDWPRFRTLMGSDAVPEAIRDDPWRADWHDIAIRTVQSGFDRRRITAQKGEELLVPRNALAKTGDHGAEGPFAGPSPFAKPMFPEPGVGFRFMVTPRSDTYVSVEGILRVSRGVWMWNRR